ncbi:hypothetical protein [Dactylosporangium sp. CS-033363]|uniref:hypothetical protein n=1 Tax=Dactylosporangium sp. CS-033363 TaxID=3239935 RepID=UPI003D8C1AD0
MLRPLAAALLLAPTPAPSATVLPPGLVWVDQAPGTTGSTLHAVDAQGQEQKTRIRYALNAIACTPDGLITGLATELDGKRLPQAPHLVRVSTAGAVEDLGPAPDRAALAKGYGAAAVGDHLLVSTGDRLVGIGGPGTYALPELPYTGDWATDPRTGELVSVLAVDDVARVVRLRWDAGTGVSAVDLEPVPTLPPSSAYGGVAVLADGSIAAILNRDAGPGAGPRTGRKPMSSALFRITGGKAEQLADLGAVTSSDAATCPVQAPPATTAPTTAAPTPSHRPTPKPKPVKAPIESPAPIPSLSRAQHRIPEPVVLAAALETRHKVGTRYIPVAGAIMVAAVAVSRLVRRGRR